MMTEQQRYLFDLCGYLHLSNALTPEDLDAASQAAGRYIDYRLPRLRRTPRKGRTLGRNPGRSEGEKTSTLLDPSS